MAPNLNITRSSYMVQLNWHRMIQKYLSLKYWLLFLILKESLNYNHKMQFFAIKYFFKENLEKITGPNLNIFMF